VPETEARRLLAEAVKAGEARDYGRAIEILGHLISLPSSEGSEERAAQTVGLLYLGRSHYALGEIGPAIGALKAYLREGGDEASGYFFLGRAYLACGRFQQASSCLRRSAETEPTRAPTWALLGAVCLKLRKTKAAVDCLERAVNLAPKDKRIYRGYLNALYGRGVRLLSRGDADMARQLLGFAIENGLDGPAIRLWRAKALREAGRMAEALADCEAALAAAPGDPSIRWLRAGLLLASGRMPEALREFDAIKAVYPDLPALPADDRGLARLRASIAFREGRYKEAASDCMPLLRTDPKDAALRAIAAESLRALGELERSRNHWLRAVEAAPEQPELRLGLALALYDLGDYEASLAAAERARKLGAEASEVEYYSLLCRSRLGEDPQALIPKLQSLLRANVRSMSREENRGESARGLDPRLMFALGECLYRSGSPDLAAGWFRKVLSLVPEHELSLLYLVSAAESLDDGEGQLKAYASYLEAYPDNQKIRREYLGLLCEAGDWVEVARRIEEGMPYGESGEKSRRLLALAYRNSGRFGDASIVFRDLLRERPSAPEYLLGLAYCLSREGRDDYALALLEKAPASATACAEVRSFKAALYARAGRDAEAVSALRAAVDADRSSEKAWRGLVSFYRKRGLSELAANCEEEAAAAITAALAAAAKVAAANAAAAKATTARKGDGANKAAGSKPAAVKATASPKSGESESGLKARAWAKREAEGLEGPDPAKDRGIADLDLRSRPGRG
jgi:Putative Zn-dependent protease, contains TPR repeats